MYARDGFACSGAQQMATSVVPFVRIMANFRTAPHISKWLPEKWSRVWQGQLTTEDSNFPTVPATINDGLDAGDVDDVIEEDD